MKGAPEEWAVPVPYVAPVVLQTRWLIMNEDRTGLWLRQKEHNRGRLWHIYSVTINQVMVATINHFEHLAQ
jgi:hypothetical protein